MILNQTKVVGKIVQYNSSLRPIKINYVLDGYPLGTILYHLYCNHVFNITYMRVKNNNHIFCFYTIKNIAFIIFLSFFGINKLFLKLARSIIHFHKAKAIVPFLVNYNLNFFDKRMLLLIDNKWVANPKKNYWLDKLSHNTNIPKDQLDIISIKINHALKNKLNHSEFYAEASFIPTKYNNGINQMHYVFKNIVDQSAIPNSYAYQTQYYNAEKSNFFNKQPIVKIYPGHTKFSSLLPIDKSQTDYKESFNIVNIYNIITGACYYGYNKGLASDFFKSRVKKIEDIYKEYMAFMEPHQLTLDQKNYIFFKYINKSFEEYLTTPLVHQNNEYVEY